MGNRGKNVQQFLNTYQNQDLQQNDTPNLNITFIQDRNLVLEILQKQINEINGKIIYDTMCRSTQSRIWQ